MDPNISAYECPAIWTARRRSRSSAMVNCIECQQRILDHHSVSITDLDPLALRQTDPGLVFPNDEDIVFSSCKLVVDGVFQVDNVEAPIVSLATSDNPNSSHVATTNDHGDDTRVEANEVGDLSGG